MSIDIVVVRGDGLRRGADVEDRLLCTVEAAVARGRGECDENSGLQKVSMSCTMRPDLEPGIIVTVLDALQGETWSGKITSVSHIDNGDTSITRFEVARPQ